VTTTQAPGLVRALLFGSSQGVDEPILRMPLLDARRQVVLADRAATG